MSLAKLNARDVAKDFGMQAKAITAILTEHTKETVSPTKTLTDRELSIIFEHLTQKNQVDSIESTWFFWVRCSKMMDSSRSVNVLVGDTVSLVCSVKMAVMALACIPKSLATSRAFSFARLKQATS